MAISRVLSGILLAGDRSLFAAGHSCAKLPGICSLHVMAGFMPAIHVFLAALKQDVVGRDKPGHDDR